jgi:phosphopantetheine adenylyltransferase
MKSIIDYDKSTAMLLGRWQPWHKGHQELFKKALEKTGQVIIMIREMPISENNPFNIEEVKKNINEALVDYVDQYEIMVVPNITNICYGRGVGYKIEEIELPKEIQEISATKIRKQLNASNKKK